MLFLLSRYQYVDGKVLRRPPSTTKTLPVQYAPALLVRNRIVPAISSSVPDLSNGTLLLGKTPSPMSPAAISEGNTVDIISLVPNMAHDIIISEGRQIYRADT